MAYKRRRTSKKGKRSKKNSAPFAVSLKSRKHKDTVTNSQVQKRLESLFQKRGKLGEYNRLKENLSTHDNEIASDTAPGSSMLSTQHLLSTVKSKVGIMYHNKVERLFEFLKVHPSLLTWTDFGEAIVNGIHLPGSNVHEMLDYLFHDWRKFSKQSPPQGLDKLIPVLFQNGFDPQDVVNRRLKVFSYANELCKSPSLIKRKQRTMSRQGIKWATY